MTQVVGIRSQSKSQPALPGSRDLIDRVRELGAPASVGDTDWVNVGDATDPLSPAWQNSWGNPGGDYPPMRFRLGEDGDVRLEGSMVGGADGTVAFTLPEGYRPEYSVRFVGAMSTGSDFMTLQFDPNGDVTVVARGYSPADNSISVVKLAIGSGTNGQVLTIVSGHAAWADPVAGTAATTEIELAGTVVGSRGTINLTDDGVASVGATDDSGDDRINVVIGVRPGAEGQVLTTVSGAVIWQDPAAPSTPPTVYPTIAVGGVNIAAEPTIDFEGSGVVSVTGVDTAGTDVAVTVELVPGTSGQVLQTDALGDVVWGDTPPTPKTVVIDWADDTLPALPGPTQVWRVPTIGGIVRTFDLVRITLRVETVGSSPTSVTVQKSPSGGSFVATAIGSASVASGVHEDTEDGTGLGGALGTVQSGDLVRVNFTALGTGAKSWWVQVEAIEEV